MKGIIDSLVLIYGSVYQFGINSVSVKISRRSELSNYEQTVISTILFIVAMYHRLIAKLSKDICEIKVSGM